MGKEKTHLPLHGHKNGQPPDVLIRENNPEKRPPNSATVALNGEEEDGMEEMIFEDVEEAMAD